MNSSTPDAGAGSPGSEDTAPTPSQTEVLIEAARDVFDLMHDPQGRPFARPVGSGDARALRIPSRTLRERLQLLGHAVSGSYPRKEVVNAAMDALSAEAVHQGRLAPAHVRVAWHEETMVLDLADGTGRVIEVTSSGWNVTDESPVPFAYIRTAEALPEPTRGGSLESLRDLINVGEDDFMMLVAFLLMTLVARWPHPVLVLQGEQGSGKSTASRMIKGLVDPGAAPLRSAPTSPRDLAVGAEGNWIVPVDNLSSVPTWLSDAWCRLSTGGGFSTRALYSDSEEQVFDQLRALILNGIDAIVTRQDLLDRAMVITLERPATFRSEAELWERFEVARPLILGALLDVASEALRRLPQVEFATAGRMADFERWIAAAGPALGWPAGRFAAVYADNRANSLRASLDGSLVASAIQRHMRHTDREEGTPTDLHQMLRQLLSEGERRRWPANAQSMSRELKRLIGALHGVGLRVTFTTMGRGGEKTRWIEIANIEPRMSGDAGDAGDVSSA